MFIISHDNSNGMFCPSFILSFICLAFDRPYSISIFGLWFLMQLTWAITSCTPQFKSAPL